MFGPCPDCPRDIDLKSHGNMEKLKRTLQEFNSNGGWLKYFVLLNVISAQAQVHSFLPLVSVVVLV